MYRNELYHHGILGQKWGKRNGPPYPLSASNHSASEKKAGYQKSIRNAKASTGSYQSNSDTTQTKEHKGLSDKAKRNIKIGIAATAAALAVAGGIYLAKSGKLQGIGRNACKQFVGGSSKQVSEEVIKRYGEIQGPHSIDDDMSVLNPFNSDTNCAATSAGVIIRQNYNLDVVAIDRDVTTWSELEQLFPGAKRKMAVNKNGSLMKDNKDFSKYLLKRFKEGDNGIISLPFANKIGDADGHYVSFFIQNKKVMISDPQLTYKGNKMPLYDLNSDVAVKVFNMIYKGIKFDTPELSFMQTNNQRLTDDINVLNEFFTSGKELA